MVREPALRVGIAPAGALLALALVGCSKGDHRVALVFPDLYTANKEMGPDGPKAVTNSLVVTSVEPFVLKEDFDGISRPRMIKCGDIGVFPPTSEYDRGENELVGIPRPLGGKEYQAYPLTGEWTLGVPEPGGGADNNPWGAVLVHVEARGRGREYSAEEGLRPGADQTLLEGCFCMRMNEGADSADHPLDEAVKNACVGASVFEAGPLDVLLEAVMPPVFFLRAKGVTSMSAVSGQVLRLEPGVEVSTIECRQATTQTNCYQCESDSCRRLDKKRRVPLRVEILGDVDASAISLAADSEVVVTNDSGVVVPEIQVRSCNADFQVRLSLVGRASENVTFDVRCVDRVQFEPTPVPRPVQIAQGGENALDVVPRGSTIVPAAVGVPTLAVLSNVKGRGARADLFRAEGGFGLSHVGSVSFPGETPRGAYGFFYDRRAATPSRPVLAVATSSRPAGREELIIRVLELEDRGSSVGLREVQRMVGACPSCGCRQAPACEACAERDPKGILLPSATGSGNVGCRNQNCEDVEQNRCANGACFCDTMATGIPPGFEGACRLHPYCQSDGECAQQPECGDIPCYCERPLGAQPGERGRCKSEACFVKLNPTARALFASPDLNRDGFADLVVAVNEDLAVTTLYSAPHRSDHSADGGPLALPPFKQTCQCQSMGKFVQSFALLQLGGPSDAPGVDSYDFVMGDATGAFVRYAEESVADGTPCLPVGEGVMSQCPAGRTCVFGCGSDRYGRCVTPCTLGDDSTCPDPAQPVCLPLQGGGGACGAPVLGCRAPKSVWQLTGVSDVGAIRLRVNSPYQDVVAVAAGSALSMAAEGGRIRILYGGEIDLTNRDALPADQVRTALLDISPVRAGNGPQGAKSLQVADFNGDGREDFAVLYGTSEEVRVWLGGPADAPVEISSDLEDTPSRFIQLRSGDGRCFPLDRFTAGDLDGDGKAEVIVICNPEERMLPATIHWVRPSSR